jgi:hypothetical protein
VVIQRRFNQDHEFMTDTTTLGLPDAARRFGVPIRVLRRAIRAGKIPAPAGLTATVSLSAEWLSSAEAAVKASPNALSRNGRPKVPPFARYKGTSAWHKYPVRVREYARFRAAAEQAAVEAAAA